MSLRLLAQVLNGGGGPPAGTVTLSGETIADAAAGDRLYRAVLVIRTTGILDKIENVTTTQIDAATDWIDPNGDAEEDFEFKYDLDSGAALDGSSTMAENVWTKISSHIFLEQRWTAGSGVGGNTSGITVRVRFNGGAEIDTGVYSLQAERLF